MRTIALLLLFGFVASPALAHKASDSYLTLNVAEKNVEARWDIALRDLEYAIELDGNGDGNITWGELRKKSDEIARLALAHLKIGRGATPCAPSVKQQMVESHSDGNYVVLPITFACADPTRALRVEYRLFFDIDPTHRGLANIVQGGRNYPLVFAPGSAVHVVQLAETSWRQSFYQYLIAGMQHILIGVDHILFLLSLLLSALMMEWRRNARPDPALYRSTDSVRSPLMALAKTVTAFSVAHSLTLGLSFFDVVHPPVKWVEAGIALSVIVASFNNIFRVVPMRDWLMAFCFGLIHGLGFANTLSDLALSDSARLYALAAFNLGVELGQLSIVIPLSLLFFPMRRTVFYRRFVVGGGSVVICVIGFAWLIERVFDVSWLPV